MDFSDDSDEESGFLNSETQRQGKKIKNSLAQSYEAGDLARRAAVNLRGQRD